MILDLLFTGCCLVGLSIGGFNLLMFAADYYSAPVKKEKFMVAIRAIFKPLPSISSIPEYNMFSSDTAFTVDKTGRLRYMVKIRKTNSAKEEPIRFAGQPAAQRTL